MSTGCGWEGIRQVCATLLGVRHVPISASAVAVSTKGRYNKCSTFPRCRHQKLPGGYIVHRKHCANGCYSQLHRLSQSINQSINQGLPK